MSFWRENTHELLTKIGFLCGILCDVEVLSKPLTARYTKYFVIVRHKYRKKTPDEVMMSYKYSFKITMYVLTAKIGDD